MEGVWLGLAGDSSLWVSFTVSSLWVSFTVFFTVLTVLTVLSVTVRYCPLLSILRGASMAVGWPKRWPRLERAIMTYLQ